MFQSLRSNTNEFTRFNAQANTFGSSLAVNTSEIKVFLVDDHQIFIDGLKGILDEVDGIKVVGSSVCAEKALLDIKDLDIDVLILDIHMPKFDGFRCAEFLRRNFSKIKILGLSMNDDLSSIRKMLAAGAHGYIFKNVLRQELITAITKLHEEGTYLNPDILQLLLSQERKPKDREQFKLTKRERDVLKLIAEGFQNPEIAEQLHISLFTVKSHRKNILSKLNLRNTAELVRYAIENCIG